MITIKFLNKLKIYEGQIRGKEFCHNVGWYNEIGEKIGWGDLDIKDLNKIAERLPVGEAFFILGEQDSFWKFVEKFGIIGGMCKTNEKEKNPGLDYVLDKFRYMIKDRKIYGDYPYNDKGLVIEKIDRDQLKRLLCE